MSDLYTDWYYANLLPLDRKVVQGQFKLNFRCPICGDSKKNPRKKRGYIYVNDKGTLMYHCFNCGYHTSFRTFLKENYPEYYRDYIKELFQNTKKQKAKEITKEDISLFKTESSLNGLTHISKLPSIHRAKYYLESRKIPVKKFEKYLYYTDYFLAWHKGEEIKENTPLDERLVLVAFDKDGKTPILATGRALKKGQEPKYLTHKFNDSKLKIWGLDRVNPKKTILITEGIIDAMFLPNSLAMLGGFIDLKALEELFPNSKFIFVLDNEPHNRNTVNNMIKVIQAGHRLFFWDKIDPKEIKDINDMVLKGYSKKDILLIIKGSIIKGLKGMMKIKLWRKC